MLVKDGPPVWKFRSKVAKFAWCFVYFDNESIYKKSSSFLISGIFQNWLTKLFRKYDFENILELISKIPCKILKGSSKLQNDLVVVVDFGIVYKICMRLVLLYFLILLTKNYYLINKFWLSENFDFELIVSYETSNISLHPIDISPNV